MLASKKILLAVTGSISAYKAAYLVRLLKKEKAEVKVIMSRAAHAFITPLTLATLSENPVSSDFVADQDKGTWNNHVDLALWADIMLVAPASANTLSKMASGQSDSLLLACYLSAKCPVAFAPAMDRDMILHEATQDNIKRLAKRGDLHFQSEFGELASGLEGGGRLAEPEHLLEQLKEFFASKSKLDTKKILISAGPTREAIDPVRYIGNRSSGKMGYALVNEALSRGAHVSLVTGPTQLEKPQAQELVEVESAEEMYEACIQRAPDFDVIIMSAAVADFKPSIFENQKIKKEKGIAAIELESTKDILKRIGEMKKSEQVLIGFALESENGLENAKKKLQSKNLDAIVLNTLEDEKAGFGVDTNLIRIIAKDDAIDQYELKPKTEVAKDILNYVEDLL